MHINGLSLVSVPTQDVISANCDYLLISNELNFLNIELT